MASRCALFLHFLIFTQQFCSLSLIIVWTSHRGQVHAHTPESVKFSRSHQRCFQPPNCCIFNPLTSFRSLGRWISRIPGVAFRLGTFPVLLIFPIVFRRSSGASAGLPLTVGTLHAFEQFHRRRRHNGGIDPSQQNSSHLHRRALRSPSPTG